MNRIASFFSIFATTIFICSSTYAVILEIEADLVPSCTQKIRQPQPTDTGRYWEENAGRYTLDHDRSEINPNFTYLSQRYDHTNHKVTFVVTLEDFEKSFPSKSVKFNIDTVVYDVGKSEYNPKYSYSFMFELPEKSSLSLDRGLKITVHPFKIMHMPAKIFGDIWGPRLQQVRYVPPVPTFEIQSKESGLTPLTLF